MKSLQENEITDTINKTVLEAPPLWKQNPALWFHYLERQFQNAGVTTDDSKYHTIVAALDADVLCNISDLIGNPPHKDMYEIIKTRIINEYTESDERKINRLLTLSLGNRKPSELLKEMKQLAAGMMTDDAVRIVWIQKLPAGLRSTVVLLSGTLDKIALMADKMIEMNPSQSDKALQQLQHKVYELEVALEQVKENQECRPYKRKYDGNLACNRLDSGRHPQRFNGRAYRPERSCRFCRRN